jgi:pyruvate dehydrogenase complex dehydrogenase (E1) component
VVISDRSWHYLDRLSRKLGEERDVPVKARKREPLVHQHLENVSRDLLESHPELVREFVGRNAGILGVDDASRADQLAKGHRWEAIDLLTASSARHSVLGRNASCAGARRTGN